MSRMNLGDELAGWSLDVSRVPYATFLSFPHGETKRDQVVPLRTRHTIEWTIAALRVRASLSCSRPTEMVSLSPLRKAGVVSARLDSYALVNREVLPDMDPTGFSDSLPRSNLACPQNRGSQSPPRGPFLQEILALSTLRYLGRLHDTSADSIPSLSSICSRDWSIHTRPRTPFWLAR